MGYGTPLSMRGGTMVSENRLKKSIVSCAGANRRVPGSHRHRLAAQRRQRPQIRTSPIKVTPKLWTRTAEALELAVVAKVARSGVLMDGQTWQQLKWQQ